MHDYSWQPKLHENYDDMNMNGEYDSFETFYDYNGNGVFDEYSENDYNENGDWDGPELILEAIERDGSHWLTPEMYVNHELYFDENDMAPGGYINLSYV